MASKSELSKLNVSKNRENSERRRPSIHFVDLSDTLVFTREELEKEISKIPEQKLRMDEDGILSRTSNVQRAPSLVTPGDLFNQGHLDPKGRGRKRAGPRSVESDQGGSLDRRTRRRQSSLLSTTSSINSGLINSGLIKSGLIKSGSSSDIHRHSPETRSFYELIQSTKNLQIGNQFPEEEFPYPDPIPIEMRFLDMRDLISTNIDWKMLTMKRPESRLDEEYFSRVVEMKRLELKTKTEDGFGLRQSAFRITRHPKTIYKYRSRDMDTDFDLDSFVPDIDYESYARQDPDENQMNQDQAENANELVAKLLGDDFSDNFTTGKEKELVQSVRRKSSVKKLAKGQGVGGKNSPVQNSKAGQMKSGAKQDSDKKNSDKKHLVKSESPVFGQMNPKGQSSINPKEKNSINSKERNSLNSKVKDISSINRKGNLVNAKKRVTTRSTKLGTSRKERSEPERTKEEKPEEKKEGEEKEKMEEEKEENRFANTWIDATKEKEAPRIVVTGTLPGE